MATRAWTDEEVVQLNEAKALTELAKLGCPGYQHLRRFTPMSLTDANVALGEAVQYGNARQVDRARQRLKALVAQIHQTENAWRQAEDVMRRLKPAVA